MVILKKIILALTQFQASISLYLMCVFILKVFFCRFGCRISCCNIDFFAQCSKLKNNKVIRLFFRTLLRQAQTRLRWAWTLLRRARTLLRQARTLLRHASDKSKTDILKTILKVFLADLGAEYVT